MKQVQETSKLSFDDFKQQVLTDFRLACLSREASLLGRKTVLTGKAKFGIFGDGKEIAQIAMARAFKPGDFKSGYYRDQTFMMAKGVSNVQQFFAQLYAHADVEADPFSAGRQMNAHFASRLIDEDGNWINHKDKVNVAADSSPTGSQMARAVGTALASKMYREIPALQEDNLFSDKGGEITVVTIGDASTSEGIFWESVNAAGVMRIPLAICVWDDGYGISVPIEYQTTKGSISEALAGFQTNAEGVGMDIYTGKGWDYPGLCELFEKGMAQVRETHRPALFHIKEVTQPQGHSTSGSHERYKSPERLQWEKDFDCIEKMREWILSTALATAEELEQINESATAEAREQQKAALKSYEADIKGDRDRLLKLMDQLAMESEQSAEVGQVRQALASNMDPIRKEQIMAAKQMLVLTRGESTMARQRLIQWVTQAEQDLHERYGTYLHSESDLNALEVPEEKAVFSENSPLKNGFEILNACFDANFERDPSICAFGEDLGHIGDVNQGFSGLQEKYGIERIFDTGIREATIMGQGIGLAMRGLRPIAEIQYLDYLIYGLQPLVDDLATLQYRSRGAQKAPLIVRTRGHRLEGIWHTGSPIGMILNSLRGMRVLVPRNMTQAAGFYNTMLRSDEPALIIECLNGYRLKERLPDNIGTYTLPLGQPEILQEGTDLTLVTYGSCVRIVQDALKLLEDMDISVELIDVQSLLPFDLDHAIVESVKKTSRLLVVDEDVPGGASAFILQQILEKQGGYAWLDSAPKTLTAAAHRSPYGSDGDYYAKPSREDVFEAAYGMMHEADPESYPLIY